MPRFARPLAALLLALFAGCHWLPPAPAAASMSESLCDAVPGLTASGWGPFRRLCPAVNFVPGWQDGSAPAVVGGVLQVYFSYWREDAAWYNDPARAAWFGECVAAEYAPEDLSACVASAGVARCQQRWFDHCEPLCLADESCPHPVRGADRANPNPARWAIYRTDLGAAGFSTPAQRADLNLSPPPPQDAPHNASFTPFAIGGMLVGGVLTRWGDLYTTGWDGQNFAAASPPSYPINTLCGEDEGTLAYEVSAGRTWIYFTSDRKVAAPTTFADCGGPLRVWRAYSAGGAFDPASLALVTVPGVSVNVSQAWVPWDLSALWWNAADADCASGGNPALTCVYRADGDGHGAWSNRTLEVLPTPFALAADGDAVAVGECNPADVPSEGRWLFCTAWLHHPSPTEGQQAREFVLVAAPEIP